MQVDWVIGGIKLARFSVNLGRFNDREEEEVGAVNLKSIQVRIGSGWRQIVLCYGQRGRGGQIVVVRSRNFVVVVRS